MATRKGQTLVEIYNSRITIPMLDPIIHTDEHPYCDDPGCPCNANVIDADETGTHAPDCRCGWCEPQEQSQIRNVTIRTRFSDWW